MRKQRRHPRYEMIVDNFAGGGGWSTGIELALGRSPDAAINHDPVALAMHEANHPHTRHYPTDVFEVDPIVVVRNSPVGLAVFSPDCKHFSKAKGNTPVSKRIRGLAWVVIKWAMRVRPRVIMVENVEEFVTWGPVVNGKPCPARKGNTFRLWLSKLRRLGYAVESKVLRACDYGAPTIRKRLFVIARCDGRPIVWPEPTHGKPGSADVLAGKKHPWRTAAENIDWSLPCHSIFLSAEEAKALKINRPLKPNTMRRIYAGLKRYVIDNPTPYIVTVNHGESGGHRTTSIDSPLKTATAKRSEAVVMPYFNRYNGEKSANECRAEEVTEPLSTLDTSNRFGLVTPFLASPAHSTTTGRGPNHWPLDEPLRTTTSSNDKTVIAPILSIAQQGGSNRSVEDPTNTITASSKDQNTLAAAYMVKQNFGDKPHYAANEPIRTVVAGGGHESLVQAFIAQHNAGPNNTHLAGRAANAPLSTIVARGTQQQIVTSHLQRDFGQSVGADITSPVPTITAGGGGHVAEVRAFLAKYYGDETNHQACDEPLHTVPTHDRFGVVTVSGVDYQIIDIGMRMLTPRELFLAQGFPPTYKIDVWCKTRYAKKLGKDGKPRQLKPGMITKDAQTKCVGNSVCPDLAKALVAANVPELRQRTPRKEWQRELAGV